MSVLAAILSLLTGAAGWFYMFYSRAAQGLADVEEQRLNDRRIRLRRVGGGVMVLLAILLYLGFYAVAPDVDQRAFVAIWLAVMSLLAMLVILALIDLRFTLRLRRRRLLRQSEKPA